MNQEFDTLETAQDMLSSADLEAQVLSVLTAFPAAFDEYADKLSAETFFLDDHKKIFNELCKQHREGVAVDALTLIQPLIKAGLDAEYVDRELE